MDESAEVNRYVIPFCVVIILLHAWAALYPSHYNWGFHQFAFYPVWAGSLGLLICAVQMFSRPRSAALHGLTRLVQRMATIPMPLLLVLLAVLLVAAAVVLQAKGLLLGDSYFLSQLSPENPGVADRTANFRNQPLTYALIRGIRYLVGAGSAVSVERTYQAVGVVAGVCFLATLFAFLKDFSTTAVDRALIGAFLLFRVATEFFLGYVENYAFFYVGLTAYFCCSWMVIEDRLHWSVPAVLLAVNMGLHVGSLFFLPSLIALLIGKNQIRAMLATVVVIGLSGVGVLAISGGGLSLENLVQRVQSALLFDFLSLQSPSSAGAYAILSRAHLVDWANALMMNAPFAPLGILFILISWNRLWDTHKVLLIFLLTASACGVLFTLVFNPGLGMARDWDLLSVFFLPTSFLTLLGLVTTLKARHLRHALVILVILRMLRAGAWFGVNANEEDHIARAEMLTAPELSGPIHKYYYEAVADVYWKRSNFDKARHWYELYCLDDSTNTRIIGNLASCYEILGDTIKEEATLARAAALGSSNPGVYSNLGLRLIRRGQIDSAIVYLEKSLRLKPSFAVAHANLAAAYRRIQRFDLTAEHAVSAIRFGMNKPPLYKTAAIAYRECGKESLALAYVDAYIKQVPQDGWGRRMREELVTALNRSRR